jgi:DNA-binding NarL/FixJ family response regulator
MDGYSNTSDSERERDNTSDSERERRSHVAELVDVGDALNEAGRHLKVSSITIWSHISARFHLVRS